MSFANLTKDFLQKEPNLFHMSLPLWSPAIRMVRQTTTTLSFVWDNKPEWLHSSWSRNAPGPKLDASVWTVKDAVKSGLCWTGFWQRAPLISWKAFSCFGAHCTQLNPNFWVKSLKSAALVAKYSTRHQ